MNIIRISVEKQKAILQTHMSSYRTIQRYVFQLLQVHVQKIHVHKDFTSAVRNISPKVAISTYNTTDHHWGLDSSG